MAARKETGARRWRKMLAQLQAEDLVEATRRARRAGMARLEDQGIAALALLISEVLVQTLERSSSPSPTESPPAR